MDTTKPRHTPWWREGDALALEHSARTTKKLNTPRRRVGAALAFEHSVGGSNARNTSNPSVGYDGSALPPKNTVAPIFEAPMSSGLLV